MKKFLLIPVLLFFVCVASAQTLAGKTGSLLWRISGNGLTTPSYIFGTHHAFPVSFLDSVAGVKQAFANCEQMVGEILMNDMAATAVEIQKAAMMPKDTTWQMLLSEEDYRFVDEQLMALFGAGLQGLGVLKPAMVHMTYIAYYFQKMFPQMSGETGADMWFQQQSASRGIPIIGLETAQDQIAIFDVQSLKRQAADLVCTLQNTDYTEVSTRKLNRLYRSADLTGLAALFREEGPCPSSEEQDTALNDARNARWLKKLPDIMHEKSTFVAVGCLHLVGNAGLLAGFEKAGYTVEAVKN